MQEMVFMIVVLSAIQQTTIEKEPHTLYAPIFSPYE